MDHFKFLFIIILFLFFEKTSKMFSTVAAPIYIPTNSVGGFTFSYTPSVIYL